MRLTHLQTLLAALGITAEDQQALIDEAIHESAAMIDASPESVSDAMIAIIRHGVDREKREEGTL